LQLLEPNTDVQSTRTGEN